MGKSHTPDANLLHISYEGSDLEVVVNRRCGGYSPEQAPDILTL